MQSTTVALIGASVTFLGVLGGVIGVIVGQSMTRNSQRNQWLRDKRTEEYRELIDALTTTYMDQVELWHLNKSGWSREDEEWPGPNETEVKAYHILRSRLFTARALEEERITERWTEALYNFKKTRDEKQFAKRFDGIVASIVRLSTEFMSRRADSKIKIREPS